MLIEVRLLHPVSGEVLADEFTATSPSTWHKTDHSAMHRLLDPRAGNAR